MPTLEEKKTVVIFMDTLLIFPLQVQHKELQFSMHLSKQDSIGLELLKPLSTQIMIQKNHKAFIGFTNTAGSTISYGEVIK